MSSSFRVVGVRLRTTAVYDAYWRFADERQRTFFRKKRGDLILTSDPIIAAFRFTNAYRVIDRVTQFLISTVIAESTTEVRDLFFRVLLFKIFNKIETWHLLEGLQESLHIDTFDWSAADSALTTAIESGSKIYSAAYIMPSPQFGNRYKHTNHLALLRSLTERRLSTAWAETVNLQELYESLLEVPSFGKFLAYQYSIDLNYTDAVAFDEDSFVVAGPGALDGISKCFENADGVEPDAIIKAMVERQELEFERLNLDFPRLYGRKLKLIDCQNLFCEISKYSRVSHPHIQGASSRTSIKQSYKPKFAKIDEPRFPASWSMTPSSDYDDSVVPVFPR